MKNTTNIKMENNTKERKYFFTINMKENKDVKKDLHNARLVRLQNTNNVLLSSAPFQH